MDEKPGPETRLSGPLEVEVGRISEEGLQRYFVDADYCLDVQKLNFHEAEEAVQEAPVPAPAPAQEPPASASVLPPDVNAANVREEEPQLENRAGLESEEGEVEQDVAEYINSKSAVSPAVGNSERDVEAEEEDIEQETMVDSDPISSEDESDSKDSSPDCSDEDEDWRAFFRRVPVQGAEKQDSGGIKLPGGSDDEEDDDQPPKTKNEVLDFPPVPKVEVQLQPHHQLISVGRVSSVLDVRVVVEGDEKHSALDEGSILWLLESRLPLGFIDEVFGPVKRPFYVVRFNNLDEMPQEICIDLVVGFVPDFAKTVLQTPNLFKKGYDASGVNDEELSEDEVDFSDDEKEAEYKRMKKASRKGVKEDDIQDMGQKRRPLKNFPRKEAQESSPYYGRQRGDRVDRIPAGSQPGEPDSRVGHPQMPNYWSDQVPYFPGSYRPVAPPMPQQPMCFDMNHLHQMQGMQYQRPGFYPMPMPGFCQGPPPNTMFVPGQGWWAPVPVNQPFQGLPAGQGLAPDEMRSPVQRPSST